MNARRWPLGLAAAGLLLTGCGSGSNPGGSGGHTPMSAMPMAAGQTMAGMSMAPGETMGNPTSTAGTGVQSMPTSTALMICGDDIKGKVKEVVKLSSEPRTSSSFAHQIYTCSYQLPVGPLVLSVQHSDTKVAATTYYNEVRAELGRTAPLDGLGDEAYGAATGVTVVMKDNETLVVDARGVPAVFGADGQKRTDFANEIASDVLGCWTGD